jgi:hypothetical protein
MKITNGLLESSGFRRLVAENSATLGGVSW